MTEIPRKPTFPIYMIQKLITKIQSDVNEDVIPVSTGIYSYQKLKNKLQAIPKPYIQNYQDKIFFEIIEDRLGVIDKTGEKCRQCQEQYNAKKNPPVMCNFCSAFSCGNCMPGRKRAHPLSKDSSGKRYNICHHCDTKYLNLQLGHSYVQNRTLLEQAITKTSSSLQQLENQCKQYSNILTKSKQSFQKNKFKISQLKKEKLQLNKDIKNKLPEGIRLGEEKNQHLKKKFIEVHLKHKEWLDVSESRKKEYEKVRIQRERERAMQRERQKKQQDQQQRRKREIQKQQQDQMQRKRTQMQRQQYQIQQRKFQQQLSINQRKTPSLSQNSTFTISYSTSEQQKKTQQFNGYDNMRKEESEEEEQLRERRVSRKSDRIEDSPLLVKEEQQQQQSQKGILIGVKESAIDQKEIQLKGSMQSPIAEQSQGQAFAEYFTHQQQPKDSLYVIEKSLEEVKENIKINYNQNYTFSQELIGKLHPYQQPSHWHYSQHEKQQQLGKQHQVNKEKQKERQKQKEKQSHDDYLSNGSKQYTFSHEGIQQNRKEKESSDNPIHLEQPEYIEDSPYQIGNDSAHLSYASEWYINQQSTQTHSQLSTLLNHHQQYHRNNNKKLQQQCTKSTSQLDQNQLQEARYSLLKAARDSLVQQRQKNKIYQRSVHQHSAPQFDEQGEGIGEAKKCQCSIY